MANAFYTNAHTQLVSGAINWTGYGIHVMAVTSGYTFSAAHSNLSDIPSGNRLNRGTTVNSGTGTYDTSTTPKTAWGPNPFSTVPVPVVYAGSIQGGAVAAALVVYHNTGTDSTSTLIGYYDTFDVGSVPFNTTGVQYLKRGTLGFFTNNNTGGIVIGKFELHAYPPSIVGLVSADHRWPLNHHTRCGPFFSYSFLSGPPYHPVNLYCILEKIDDGGTGLYNVDVFKSTDQGLTWSNILTLPTQTRYPAPAPYSGITGLTGLGGYSCSFDRFAQRVIIAIQTGTGPFGLVIYKLDLTTDTVTLLTTLPTTWPVPLVYNVTLVQAAAADGGPLSRFSITALPNTSGTQCIVIHPRATYENIAGVNYDRVAWSYFNGTSWTISNADFDPRYANYTAKTFHDTPVDAIAKVFGGGANLVVVRSTLAAPAGNALVTTTASTGGPVNPQCEFYGVGSSPLMQTTGFGPVTAHGMPHSAASAGLGLGYGIPSGGGNNTVTPYAGWISNQNVPIFLNYMNDDSPLNNRTIPSGVPPSNTPTTLLLTSLFVASEPQNGVDITFNPNDEQRIHMVYNVWANSVPHSALPTLLWASYSDQQPNPTETSFSTNPLGPPATVVSVYNEADIGSSTDDTSNCSIQCVQTPGEAADPFQIMIAFQMFNQGYTPIASDATKGVYYTLFTPPPMRVSPGTTTNANYVF